MNGFHLDRREYRQLQDLTKRSDDAVVVQRAHALLGLHEGIPVGQIAQVLDLSRQTIYNWVEAFRVRSDWDTRQRLRDAPRSGRPVIALGIIDPLIDAVIDDDPRKQGYRSTVWTASLLQRHLEELHGIAVSRKSVSRALRRLGVRWKRPRHRLARRPPTWQQSKGGSKTA
jgi:transposase